MQRSLLCLTDAVWVPGKPPLGTESEMVLTTSAFPVELRDEQGRSLFLFASQAFHFERRSGLLSDWKVATDQYIYNVRGTADGNPAHQLVEWHWHPAVRRECHVHVNGALPGGFHLGGAHLPTGRVSFEQVLLFLIREFGVVPQNEHWAETLEANHDLQAKYRTWEGPTKPTPSTSN
jgi:hypothetical protein